MHLNDQIVVHIYLYYIYIYIYVWSEVSEAATCMKDPPGDTIQHKKMLILHVNESCILL